MGVPIGQIICATNSNDIVHRTISRGDISMGKNVEVRLLLDLFFTSTSTSFSLYTSFISCPLFLLFIFIYCPVVVFFFLFCSLLLKYQYSSHHSTFLSLSLSLSTICSKIDDHTHNHTTKIRFFTLTFL